MLDNLPEMWGAMRRSITQSGNDGNTMTFAVLRNNMESELITRKSDQQQQLQSSDVSQALVAMRAMMDRPQSARRQSKRPRVIYQRTPGATCTKCKKPNHTAQQCGKAVEASDEKADGTIQMTSSDNGARRRAVNRERDSNNSASFDDYFDSLSHLPAVGQPAAEAAPLRPCPLHREHQWLELQPEASSRGRQQQGRQQQGRNR